MRPQVSNRILKLTPLLVALDRGRNGIQKILIAKWLGEEIDSAGLHGPHRHGDIAVSRNEYNRNSDIGFHQLGLEVETAQSRQAHVEHEAARHIRAPSLQKFLRRCENFNPQLDGLKKS